MSNPPPSQNAAPWYRFILFVADGEPNSSLARENLRKICDEELQERYDLEVVDVLEDAGPALEHGVVVTPALLVLEPKPKVIIAGTFRDQQKVRMALRLPGLENS